MNSTERLLRAFIEASGYEIKAITNTRIVGGISSVGSWNREEVVTIDYKVTKKDVEEYD